MSEAVNEMAGRSPLTRGYPKGTQRLTAGDRPIPADAGVPDSAIWSGRAD